MSLSDTFIRRPVLSTVCSILIPRADVISLPLLPVENLPDIAPPTIQVNASLPGADALTVESAVTGPLEEQINGAPVMDYISSNSTGEGSARSTATSSRGPIPTSIRSMCSTGSRRRPHSCRPRWPLRASPCSRQPAAI